MLLMSGPLVYSAAVASGWEPLGEPGVVTRSDNTLLCEIDGRPAMEFYRRFLGPDDAPTQEFPLAILDDLGDVESLRTALFEHESETGAISFASEVRDGARVQITTADRAAILDGCSTSVEKAFADYPHGKSPEAALFFSCCCRRILLGTRVKEEFDIIESVLGTEIPVAEFSSGRFLARTRVTCSSKRRRTGPLRSTATLFTRPKSRSCCLTRRIGCSRPCLQSCPSTSRRRSPNRSSRDIRTCRWRQSARNSPCSSVNSRTSPRSQTISRLKTSPVCSTSTSPKCRRSPPHMGRRSTISWARDAHVLRRPRNQGGPGRRSCLRGDGNPHAASNAGIAIHVALSWDPAATANAHRNQYRLRQRRQFRER